MSERRDLRFNCIADVLADVRALRGGYEKLGQWSLAQICFHLDRALGAAMKPGPHPLDTAEQLALKPGLSAMLSSGKIPSGLVAPAAATPPNDVGESAIDAFLETAVRFDHYNKPLAPHWRFGQMGDGDRRRHQLIHCAHHLSFLVPTHKSDATAKTHLTPIPANSH